MLDRVNHVAKTPAVTRWGIEPQIDEPAHGFFLRLAALNGQVSIRPFAMALGIDGRKIKPQEMLSFCEELPISNLDLLRHSTPNPGDTFVMVRGQRLRNRRDWSITHRRYCRHCLAESSHHRFWFDLVILRFCPHHGTALRTDRNGMVWAWGRSAATAPNEDESGPEYGQMFSRYLGGRLDVCPIVKVEQLDGLELDDAVYLCIVIGRIIKHGWRQSLPVHDWRESKQIAAEEGFRFLTEGGSIEDLCRQYLLSTPYLIGGSFSCTDTPKVLGWIHSATKNRIHAQGIAPVRDCVDRLIVEYGACRPLRRKFPTPEHDLQIASTARKLSLTKAEVVKIASWNEPDQSSPRNFSVDAMSRKRSLLCNPAEAARILGVSTKQLALLREAGLVRAVFDERRPLRCWYERQPLEKLVARALSRLSSQERPCEGLPLDRYRSKALCSFPAALKQVLDGEATVCGLSERDCGLSKLRLLPPSPHARFTDRSSRFVARRKISPAGYITLAKAASLLSVQPRVVANLARIGAISRSPKPGSASLVSLVSVQAFKAEYVTVQEIAVRQGCVAAFAVKKLRNMSVPIPFNVKNVGACFVKRTDVKAILTRPLPDKNSVAFFEAMQRAIVRSDYAHFLEWVPGNTHAILSGMGGKVRLAIEVDGYRARLMLPFKGARRQRALAQSKRELALAWPESKVVSLPEGEEALAEGLSFKDPTHADVSVFPLIEARALRVRAVFGRL